MLLEKGAKVDLEYQERCSPLYYALTEKNEEIIELLKIHQGADEKGRRKNGKIFVRAKRS